MMKKWLVAVLAIYISMSAVASTPANTLVVAQSLGDITSLDPAQGFELSSVQVFTNVYQRLVQPDPNHPSTLLPALAQSWQSSSHSLTLTLHKDAVFASRNPVRPEDVIFSLSRVVNLKLSPSFILTQLGWTPDNLAQHLQKVSADSVKISWDANLGAEFVLHLLSAPVASIVDQKLVQAHERNGGFGHAWLNTHSAGSGPFQVEDYTANDSLTLSANPLSPAGPPKLHQVLINNVPDAATRQLLLENGHADIARNLGIDEYQALKANSAIAVSALPYASLYYLMFNAESVDNPMIRKPEFWQAARWAFDYQDIANTVMKDQFQVQQSFLPQGFDSALLDQPFHYDPQKAKQILKQAGIKKPHFKLVVTNQPPYLDIAQALQSGFARAGIEVELLPGVSNQVSKAVNEHNYEATLSAWGPDYFDPNTNASAFAYNPEDGSNTLAWRANWHIPALSQMTLAARAETDKTKRTELYQTLQRKVRENSPFVIALQNKKLIAMKRSVKGYIQGTMPDMVYYQHVTK